MSLHEYLERLREGIKILDNYEQLAAMGFEVCVHSLTHDGSPLSRHRFRALTLCLFERQTACWTR
jgi:hypothetical protein